ncbi:hypothetical protein [Demetria terragena]|uniref:hypothetical protein n=1 Tax=Demetria terragena TaxID=63959 RepID=UPI000368FA36|nr:hypothetical protein [Demetria terragena]
MNRWRALNPSLRGVLVMVMVGVVVITAGWWFDSRHRADAGPVETTAELIGDQSAGATFKVPSGSVSVSWSLGQATSDDEVRAPRGGRLAQVSWSGRATEPLVSEPLAATDQPVRLRMRIGEKTYALDDDVTLQLRSEGRPTDRKAMVAMPTPEAHVALEAEFAGKTQSLDLDTGKRRLGAFAALYRDVLPLSTVGKNLPETRGRGNGLVWDTRWAPFIERRPYLESQGWAKPGREWVVVSASRLKISWVHSERKTGGPVTYDSTFKEPVGAALTVEAGGATHAPKAAIAARPSFDDALSLGSAVFDVPRGEALSFRLSAAMTVRAERLMTRAPSEVTTVMVVHTARQLAVFEPGADR